MTLTDILHDAFLNCGEILPASDIARIIQEYEFESGTEHDAATILKSIRDAGEQFIDSMQENGHDTDCLAQWEAMRPSVVRRKAIEVIVAPKTTDNKPVKVGNISPKKLEKLYSFFDSLDCDIENGIATCLAAKFNLCVPDVFKAYEDWQIAE